jgi:hypothetical protein
MEIGNLKSSVRPVRYPEHFQKSVTNFCESDRVHRSNTLRLNLEIIIPWSASRESGYRVVRFKGDDSFGLTAERPDSPSMFLDHALGGAYLRRRPGGMSAPIGVRHFRAAGNPRVLRGFLHLLKSLAASHGS